MDGCSRTIRKRVFPAKQIGSDRIPASSQVCRFWQQGRCNRTPCKFLHSEEPCQPQPTRKRPNPSDEEDHRENKRSLTWRRNPTEGAGEKEQQDSIATVTPNVQPDCVPKEAQKKLCSYWANGSCVHGDKCSNLHSWFTGSGLSFVADLEGHKKAVTGVSFPCGSDKLFSGTSDGCLYVWDSKSGQCVFTGQLGGQIGCMITDGPWLLAGLENGVKMWNLDSQNELHLGGANGLVRSLIFDVDTDTVYGGVEDGSILVWKVTPESSLPVIVATYKGHQKAVVSLSLGRGVIFSASEDKTLRIWHVATSKCLGVLNYHVTSLLCWEYYLITGSPDNSVKMWGMVEHNTLDVVRQVEDDSGVLALKGMYDKDKNPILFCSRTDNTVRLLHLPTLAERGRIFTKEAVQTIAVETVSSGGSSLFFTGDATGHIGVWRIDGQTNEQV